VFTKLCHYRGPSQKGSGSVAQLVEHGIEDPSVGGSIPSRATILHEKNVGASAQKSMTFSLLAHLCRMTSL